MLEEALGSLDERPDAAEALAGVRIQRFEPIDRGSLARVEELFGGAGG